VPSHRYCKLGKLLQFDDQRLFSKGSNGTQKVPSLARLNTCPAPENSHGLVSDGKSGTN